MQVSYPSECGSVAGAAALRHRRDTACPKLQAKLSRILDGGPRPQSYVRERLSELHSEAPAARGQTTGSPDAKIVPLVNLRSACSGDTPRWVQAVIEDDRMTVGR